MDAPVLNLHSLFDNLRSHVDILNESIEPQFIQMALNFEDCRSCKEVLAKAETERGALEVKLKHARNQVDVEIRRRQKAEANCEKLDCQIQLIRELLITEGSSNSLQLNEEQRSALAFLNAQSQAARANLNTRKIFHFVFHRLQTIDESASILSDISYDKTDDSLVSFYLFGPPLFAAITASTLLGRLSTRYWNIAAGTCFHSATRALRSTSRNFTDGPPSASKRSRSTGRTSEKGNESLVAKTTVTVPADGGPIEAVSTIEAVPYWSRSRRKTGKSFYSFTVDLINFKMEDCILLRVSIVFKSFILPHAQVIKPESCVPCGKRIKFAKISLKCRDCRLVTHPECRERCPLPCIPILGGTPVKIGEVRGKFHFQWDKHSLLLLFPSQGTLADYVSHVQSPMIPSLVVHCVNEIEQRGLHETGLYRLSGSDLTVKELKEKFLRGKTISTASLASSRTSSGTSEPLLTFRLNRTFMEAAELVDEDNSIALMYQTISDLPQANRATLAFMAIHLQRVTQSLDTKMDIPNLARVFGPTIVGHAVPDPEPMTTIQDTKRQPKVIERLLGLPVEYWSQFMMVDLDQLQPDAT
ncbi:unnamed protein product [Oncorhynchus mykiss]|uniref:Rho-GAP domain-containing protein n=1 Tax=Oncorhynchus mykiss TaxID=8022 RepID=A0A060WEW0_ONCMY|nr:unnamed protein product [Oncorhynchus mykiss]